VVPVLASALSVSGGERFVVVDADAENRNRMAAALRSAAGAPAEVIAEPNFYKAMDRARVEFDEITACFLATDISTPNIATAIDALRRERMHAHTPIILLVKPKESQVARDLGAGTGALDQIDVGAELTNLGELLAEVRARIGQTAVDPAFALELALESAATLRRIAIDGDTVFNCGAAEPALISALGADDEELRTRCASVLALIGTATAQHAVADLAFDAANSSSLRVAAFAALAESAKKHGNHLDDARVDRLIEIARDEADLVMRTAASQALGALNLADNKASEIIRSYYHG
jgi:hypothetical protein